MWLPHGNVLLLHTCSVCVLPVSVPAARKHVVRACDEEEEMGKERNGKRPPETSVSFLRDSECGASAETSGEASGAPRPHVRCTRRVFVSWTAIRLLSYVGLTPRLTPSRSPASVPPSARPAHGRSDWAEGKPRRSQAQFRLWRPTQGAPCSSRRGLPEATLDAGCPLPRWGSVQNTLFTFSLSFSQQKQTSLLDLSPGNGVDVGLS